MIRTNLQTYLTSLLGVSSWQTIQFSLLPGDPPVGYLQLSRVSPVYNSSTQSYTYLCWVALANTSLDGLFSDVENLINTLVSNLTKPRVCIDGVAKLSLEGNIIVDTPDSYVNNNVTTNTTGFKTAIAFQLSVEVITP